MNLLLQTDLRNQVSTIAPYLKITFKGGGVRANRPLMQLLDITEENSEEYGICFAIHKRNLYLGKMKISEGAWRTTVNKRYKAGFFSAMSLMSTILKKLEIGKNGRKGILFEVYEEPVEHEGRTYFKCAKPTFQRSPKS